MKWNYLLNIRKRLKTRMRISISWRDVGRLNPLNLIKPSSWQTLLKSGGFRVRAWDNFKHFSMSQGWTNVSCKSVYRSYHIHGHILITGGKVKHWRRYHSHWSEKQGCFTMMTRQMSVVICSKDTPITRTMVSALP